MDRQLTAGALKEIFGGNLVENPVLQVLDLKAVGNTDDRHRLYVSDGVYKNGSVMVASQMNHLIKSNQLDGHSIIRVDRYMCNTIKDAKKVLVIFELTVLCTGKLVNGILGSPVLIPDISGSNQENDQSNQVPSGNVPVVSNHSSTFSASNQQRPLGASNKPSVNVGSAQPGIHPISSLTPYQNKWTICARVTNKSSVRKWSNSRGEGKLFSVDLLDQSGEIKATAFNDQCDKFYNLIELNKVYYISQAQLKTANKQYSSLKNDYEMAFTQSTQVALCQEDTSIPTMQFQFVSINQLEATEKDNIIDVIGVCKSFDNLSTVTAKLTQKEIQKRDIQLLDDSGSEVRLTLWGEQAEKFDGTLHPVVAVKGVKVSEFNGRSLSVLASSSLTINPDIKEAHKLRAWYENCGSNLETVNLSDQRSGPGSSSMGSNFKTFGEAITEKLGWNDQADFYSTKAMPTLIRKENCMYPACAAEGCNKKVIDLNNGQYRCEKCNQEYDTFNWRLMLSVNLADGTDNVWVMVFQDQAETLLDCSAANLAALRENNSDSFDEVFQKATFKEFTFKLRAKVETYNEESRLKTTVVAVQPLDLNEYNKKLLTEIKRISQM